MSEIELGARALRFGPNGTIEEVDKGIMPIHDMPEKEQEFIRMIEEAQNISAYKDALKGYYGENYQVPEGNVAVVTIHGMGSKIFVGNEVYVPENEVPVDLVPEIEVRATSIEDVKDIIANAQGREDRAPDITSIDRENENRGNPDNNDLIRAQRAVLER